MLNKAIILHSVVPVRALPREQSEQTTQLLFGETVEILEYTDRWVHIRNDYDGQVGWADRKMISTATADELRSVAGTAATTAFPIVYAVSENNGHTIPLSIGTSLPAYKDGHFSLLGVSFKIDPTMVITAPLELNEANLQRVCRFLLNTPYLWGGRNAMGMDCSGFTQIIMKLFGRRLLRNASEQAKQGELVPSLNEAQSGDLAFFGHCHAAVAAVPASVQPSRGGSSGVCADELRSVANTGVTPAHVGLLMNKEVLIHCSGRVKLEAITEKGIPTHQLLSIRRMSC